MTWPILISIPHGGTTIPPELVGYANISQRDLLDDGDPFVDQIYDLGDKVLAVIKCEISRAFVDMNRSVNDLPPYPDGVIKTMTCYKKSIYHKKPDEKLQQILINKYHAPYHKKIQNAISQYDVCLCLDCHSMAKMGPPISPDHTERPLFCLSNQDGKTCPNKTLEFFADCISNAFHIEKEEVRLNDPFKGGHITRTFGNKPFPWIQIEINRDLYLNERWFDKEILSFKSHRLQELNGMFEEATRLFCR